MKYRKCFWP